MFRRFADYCRRTKAPVNLLMVFINIAVFIVLEFLGNTEDANFMALHGAMWPPLVIYGGEWYTLFTSMFLHFGFYHLFNNMLVLFFLGDNLERAVGHFKYLLIYIFGGLAGNGLSLFLAMRGNIYGVAVSAGASGAIFAMIGALSYVVLVNGGRLEDMTSGRLMFLIFFSLYHGFTSAGVDNAAHVGGLVAGVLLAMLLYRRKRRINYEPGGNYYA